VLQPPGIAVPSCLPLVYGFLPILLAGFTHYPVSRAVPLTLAWGSTVTHQAVCSPAPSPPEWFRLGVQLEWLASPSPD
jgi:hypothetical protein